MISQDWVPGELVIDRELWVNDECDSINVYIETWFDVDKKFGTNTRDLPDTWINLYADYWPETNDLLMQYLIDSDTAVTDHEYIPSESDKQLVIRLIEEKCQQEHGCSCAEFLKQCE